MRKILLIKTSSLGDVIHALPAVTDLKAAVPDARIGWVVEEPLVPVLRLHPGVSDIIPIAIRRWRRAWWHGAVRDEVRASLRQLRMQTYDDVIDAQGLFKSALITRAARGTRHGLDLHSAREPLAAFYDHTYRIPWDLHAVERTRLLLARAVGYALPPDCNYGIQAVPRAFAWLNATRYAVLLHASSGDYKLWDEQNWRSLIKALNAAGVKCVLPWGSAQERDRSVRIAANMEAASVPPALSLTELAGLVTGARAVVGVDTGLTHLAAALAVPTVGIFSATDPAATGIYGCAKAINLGGMGHAPTVEAVLMAVNGLIA